MKSFRFKITAEVSALAHFFLIYSFDDMIPVANVCGTVFDLSRLTEPLEVSLCSAAAEVIEYDYLMPLVAEIRSSMGTDEAAASSDENFHLYLLVSQMEIRSRAPVKGWVTP